MRKWLSAGLLLLAGTGIAQAQATLPTTGIRAVPTYESVGLYWSAPGATAATGCEVKFRRMGDIAWTAGLAMWFDARNNECRGSLVQLAAGTGYQVEFNLPGQAATRGVAFNTWSNRLPIARTVIVPSGAATLNITQGGTASGYVVYQGAPGAVLDAANGYPFNVSINASYVIVRGFTMRGAQQDAVRIANTVTDVVIEDNDISGWGRTRDGTWGTDLDSGIRAVCQTPTVQRVTIQRNEIHDPRYSANSWSDGHPAGPQAVTFSFCGGNHVIRHNEVFSTTGRYFNDAIGGEDNFSTTGFPNADSDIYGNDISNAWDDAIEAEGGNNNVRIWGNYLDNTGTGVASTVTSVGPLYMFRNVYNRGRILGKSSLDSDDRQVFFKSGSDATLGDGRRYVFHNTALQATQAGVIYGLGSAGGISGTSATSLTNNTVSRNNIFQNWRPTWTAYYDIGVGNDFAYDLFNGGAGAAVVGAIVATPVYAAGNGWTSESGGMYQLAPGSPGYDQGARIANFNDAYTGAAPDVGAHESGTGAMKFGIAASPGPAAGGGTAPSGTATTTDMNGDHRSDIVWHSDVTGQVYRMLMNGTVVTAAGMVHVAGTDWRIVADADFNGDGISDLLWRNSTTGDVYFMPFSSAAVPAAGATVWNERNPAWRIVGTPDIDGDGKADILWWNSSTGQLFGMLMNGASVGLRGMIYQEPNTAWQVVGTGDFAGSGRKNQVLWRNATTGQVYVMTVNASASAFSQSGVMVYTEPNTAWKILAAADFNGDGKTDILWRNDATGEVSLLLMNGNAILGGGVFYREPNTAWKIVAQGDYDGDGRADILWRNEATGQVYMMLMNGTAIASGSMVYTEPNAAWKILGPVEYAR